MLRLNCVSLFDKLEIFTHTHTYIHTNTYSYAFKSARNAVNVCVAENGIYALRSNNCQTNNFNWFKHYYSL